ncbi:CLUMA_CG001671, isoform A [Clunio marinus]|uniref:CLUMA_CG001671, isoform A n=1 Tax=Clunio marinus TaxID=568069 RepID=A0A1J1HKE5_9DIPT|nr:CLUMA_CG001671, isoform A [Clunio marinus]
MQEKKQSQVLKISDENLFLLLNCFVLHNKSRSTFHAIFLHVKACLGKDERPEIGNYSTEAGCRMTNYVIKSDFYECDGFKALKILFKSFFSDESASDELEKKIRGFNLPFLNRFTREDC